MLLAPAAAHELPDVVALVNAAYRGSEAKRGWTHEADYLAGQRTDLATLEADLAGSPGARVMVWRDAPKGEILGCVWLEPAGEHWYLGMLSVRPDLQDRRLGRQILDAAETLAAEAGARRMRLTVIGIRDTLIAWYERRGYCRTGETEPFPYGDLRFGEPLRADLAFVVFEKPLRT